MISMLMIYLFNASKSKCSQISTVENLHVDSKTLYSNQQINQVTLTVASWNHYIIKAAIKEHP